LAHLVSQAKIQSTR